MNVTRENTAPQMATLRIEITPEDYSGNVQKILKDYQKKASIPGFRPGHVPAGLVKKMYGKVVMAEEINKLLTDTLTNYIRDEKIDILGNPIPNKEKTKDSDFEDGETMEFYFDLGLAPEFEVKLDESLEVENHNIIVDEEMVDKYIADTQNRFGEYTHPDEAGEKDVVSGDLDEVNADGTPVEGGLHKNAFIYLDKVNEATAKAKLASLKRDEKVVFDPVAFFGTADEAKNVLMLTAAELEKPGLMLAFTLKDIVHLVPSELNAEFFEKVYPGMNLETIEEFKAQVRKDASASFTGETDKLLFNAISEALVKNTEITLPDEFMKRWLLDHEENKLTLEQIELEYPAFAESMKWQLIENRILRDNSISVSDEDIRNYVRTQLLRQMNSVSDDPEVQKRYDSIVDAFMQNKEQIQRINDQLYTAKLLDLFKSKLTLVTKEVSYDEFVNLVNEKHAHEHHHDHDHDHDHHHDHDHDHDHEGHGHSH